LASAKVPDDETYFAVLDRAGIAAEAAAAEIKGDLASSLVSLPATLVAELAPMQTDVAWKGRFRRRGQSCCGPPAHRHSSLVKQQMTLSQRWPTMK